MESHLFVCKVACRLHRQKNVLLLPLLFRETLFIFAAIELSTYCVHSISSNYTWSERYPSFNTISAPNGVVTCSKSCFHPVLLHRSLLLLHCHWCSDLRLWFFRHFTKNKLFWKWVILQVPSLRTGFFFSPEITDYFTSLRPSVRCCKMLTYRIESPEFLKMYFRYILLEYNKTYL